MQSLNIGLSKLKNNNGQINGLPKNPRLIRDERFRKLVKSIKDDPEMLELRELLVFPHNDNFIVIGGNMRLKAMIELGYKEAPCKVLDKNTSLDKLKAYIIKDNIAFGENDWDILTNEFDLDDLTEWGLEVPNLEIEQLEPEAKEDDFDAELPAKPITVLGDLYEIGEHRLLCGDSTNVDNVEKLMNGEKADMAHNDPPYGMKKEKDGVLNDNLNFDDLLQFNSDWISLQFSYLKENGSWYCWGIDEPLMDIYSQIIKPYIQQQKATFRNLITWDKKNVQGQNSENTRSYAIADEKCLFVMCGVQGFNNNSDNYFEGWEPVRDYLLKSRLEMGWDVPTMKKIVGHSDLFRDHWTSKSQFNFPTREVYNKMKAEADRLRNETKNEAFKKEYEEIKKEYYSTRAYFNNTHDNFNNVWKFDRHLRQGDEGDHPTPKPIPLCERAIKTSCPNGGLVIDFFLGSGSTMVASHQLKRKCFGMELDCRYVDVCIKRMLKLDSKLIVKRNGINCNKEFKND